MTKNFQIKTRLQDNIAVIYPRGHLDAHQVGRFEKEIVRLIKENNCRIVINGKDLSYITSAGMGIIMGYIDEVREKGGDIKLCALNPRVYEIFDLVGFTEIYEFLPEEQDAIGKFSAHAV